MVFRTLWFLRSNYDSYNRPPACLLPLSPPTLSLLFLFPSWLTSCEGGSEGGGRKCSVCNCHGAAQSKQGSLAAAARCTLPAFNLQWRLSFQLNSSYPLPLASLLLPRLLPLRVFKLLLLNFLYARFYFCFFSLVCNNCCHASMWHE